MAEIRYNENGSITLSVNGKEETIIKYLRSLIQYDKEHFTYVNNIYFIIEKFKRWAKASYQQVTVNHISIHLQKTPIIAEKDIR